MPDTPTFGRYAEIPYEQMTPEQQEGFRSMMESRGGLPGPSKIWVHNPKLAKVAGPFGAHFHAGRYSLTEREREIAVCVITSRFHSAYPTNAHERRGKEVGLPADKVEAIIAGLPTSFADERDTFQPPAFTDPTRCTGAARYWPSVLPAIMHNIAI